MKIENSSLVLASQHTRFESVSVKESLRAWVVDQRPAFERADALAQQGSQRGQSAGEAVRVSDAARQALLQSANASPVAAGQAAPGALVAAGSTVSDSADVDGVTDPVEGAEADPKLQMLITLIEAFTGRKIQMLQAADLPAAAGKAGHIDKPAAAQTSAPARQPQGWGIEYDRHESVYEFEQTSFSAQGVIRTADGKTLKFHVSLQMTREFSSESTVSFRAGDAVLKDPLVINFGGTAAQLTDQKFAFDIDADGVSDKISFVGGASGFLALDKNGNGKIDDGSELFGTKSGNGFADLALYDDDGNGWIDEADRIFGKLLIWQKAEDGTDQLSALADRRVGALYLGQVATPFDHKGSANALHGLVQATGIYIGEDGRAGTLQQVDLSV